MYTETAKIVYIILSFMNKIIFLENAVIVINFHFYQKCCFSFNDLYTMNKYTTILENSSFEALVKKKNMKNLTKYLFFHRKCESLEASNIQAVYIL